MELTREGPPSSLGTANTGAAPEAARSVFQSLASPPAWFTKYTAAPSATQL